MPVLDLHIIIITRSLQCLLASLKMTIQFMHTLQCEIENDRVDLK